MEQINQGAEAKAQAAAHRGSYVKYISVPKVPINYCISTIPAATSAQEDTKGVDAASVPENWPGRSG